MRRVAFAAVAMCFGLLFAGPAAAHADLVSMVPASGSTLLEGPSSVELTFGEEMRALGSTVVVIDPNGHEVQQGGLEVSGNVISIGVQSITTPGIYHVNFRVLSADGHVVTQSETFTLAPPSPGAAPAGEATSVPETSPIDEASPTAGYWITALLLAVTALGALGVWRARSA